MKMENSSKIAAVDKIWDFDISIDIDNDNAYKKILNGLIEKWFQLIYIFLFFVFLSFMLVVYEKSSVERGD